MTAGQIRKLVAGKPDDWEIPIGVEYGDVASKYIFVRVDGVFASNVEGGGIDLMLSLVSEDDLPDADDEEDLDEAVRRELFPEGGDQP